jgi:uncharacterized protein (TIGR00369 family)
MSEDVRAPKTTGHLDHLRRIVAGTAPAPAIASLVGLTMTRIDPGQSVFEMDAGPQHANPMGTLHGGVICDLSDAAMGTAMATTLEDDESFTTLDLTAKYFKPIWSARLRGHGTSGKAYPDAWAHRVRSPRRFGKSGRQGVQYVHRAAW